MKNGLIKILKTFSKDEIKKFKEFLQSPFFNKSQKVYKLFIELSKFHPNYNSEKLTIQNLHTKISPHLEYNYKTIERLILDLEKLALNYLGQINYEKNILRKNEDLRKELICRSIDSAFYKNIKISENILTENGIGEDEFLKKFNVECDKTNFSMVNKKLANKVVADLEVSGAIDASKNLLFYFVSNIVRSYINVYTYQISYGEIKDEKCLRVLIENLFKNISQEFLKRFLSSLNDNYYFIEMYYNIYKAFLEPDTDEYYFKCKELLNKYLHKLNFAERQFFYSRLINCCLLKRVKNINKDLYNSELFELYETFLSKDYCIPINHVYLQEGLYCNILKFALELNKLEWVKIFINNYSKKLHPTKIVNMKNYSWASYYFTIKEFSLALKYINEVEYDIYKLRFDVRNLLIMIHYSLGNFETVNSIILSYKAFIRSSSLMSEQRKKNHLEFILFIEKLIKVINKNDIGSLDFLKSKLINNNDIIQKNWLLEKVDELILNKYNKNIA